VKTVDVSENSKRYLKAKMDKIETNRKIKSITDLYRASVTLRRVTSLELL